MTRFISNVALDLEKHAAVIIERPRITEMLDHVNTDDLYIALQNPRQTGKSTTLIQLQKGLCQNGYGVAFLDLKGQNDLTKADFYRQLARDILEGLSGAIECDPSEGLPLDSTVDQLSFARYLEWLAAHSPRARKLIIILDEIGGVPDEAGQTFFHSIRKFHSDGRNQFKKRRELHQKITFVFSGALDLGRLMQGVNSPLRNCCKEFDLADFTRDEVRALAKNLESLPDEHHQAVADSVYDWTCGHPYLTQRLLGVADTCPKCRTASLTDVPGAIKQVAEDYFIYGGDANLSHILRHLRENRDYSNSVHTVLFKGKRTAVVGRDDLLSIGVLKKLPDNYLAVRNKLYEERLRIFYRENEEGRKAPEKGDEDS